MNKRSIYFENFSFYNFLHAVLVHASVRKIFKSNASQIYYIEATTFVKRIIIPLLIKFSIKFVCLDFKMKNIKDERAELVRLRIPRKDLFEIQDNIINSTAYKLLQHDTWNQDRISNYITKGVIDGGIMDDKSSSRTLYIIQVLYWHMQKNGYSQSIFVMDKRPWFYIYEDYALKYNIKLFSVNKPHLSLSKSMLHEFIRNHLGLYGFVKNIKYKQISKNSAHLIQSKFKLYVDGRGDINLENDGEHSDFFWCLNSDFSKKNILYKHHSDTEKKYLEGKNIHSVGEGVIFNNKYKRNYKKPQIQADNRFRDESKVIKSLLASYDLDRYYWGLFFKTHEVKIYLTWYKYSNVHMAVADAVSDNGGISVIWQMAFEGYESIGSSVDFDISFCFSSYSYEIDKRLNSNIKYAVITGYPKDHVGSLLKNRAKILRERLKANGAKKIVFVIDENSNDDPRWHTGHELQRENYSYILEKMLEISWLGVIFKPKTAKTLRKRLGSVAKLLAKAEETGRCYIYETSGRYTTSAPPVLAGLSADVCIHSHLCGGTAALECALEGLPTLLLDREGAPSSKLNDLPQGKVIFKDWPSIIEAVMEHFTIPQGIPGFGDWSSIINDLDPFRDGMAANRMGTYLHWLMKGYEQGLDKDTIMANAAAQYQEKWGAEKVVCH